MKFTSVLFLTFIIYFFRDNSVGANANGGQANQQQTTGSVSQPFWAARGRRGGDIGSFFSDNDNINAAASVNSDEIINTFDKLSKTRPTFPFSTRGFPGLSESVLTKEDYYNPKWRGVSSLYSPDEVHWYLVSKRNGHNSSPPDLPFWAARG